MRARAITLIELLISVAIIAILSTGFVFSTTQIVTRSVMVQRLQRLEESLSMTLDVLAADVAQASGGIAEHPGELVLTLPPGADGSPRTVWYCASGGVLTRRLEQGERSSSLTLVSEGASAEFRAGAEGVAIVVTAQLQMGWCTGARRLEASVTWPRITGETRP